MSAKREIKQERAVQTRKEILEAAIRLFSRRGFLATTMTEMAKAIKMTAGALYWHFATKEDLLLGAVEELHERYITEFAQALTPERRALSARDQLAAFMQQTNGFVSRHWEYGIFFGLMAAESAENSPRIAETIREKIAVYVETIGGIIRYGQQTGEFRQDVEADTLAHALIASHIGTIIHLNLFGKALSYERVFGALEKVGVDGLDKCHAPGG